MAELQKPCFGFLSELLMVLSLLFTLFVVFSWFGSFNYGCWSRKQLFESQKKNWLPIFREESQASLKPRAHRKKEGPEQDRSKALKFSLPSDSYG